VGPDFVDAVAKRRLKNCAVSGSTKFSVVEHNGEFPSAEAGPETRMFSRKSRGPRDAQFFKRLFASGIDGDPDPLHLGVYAGNLFHSCSLKRVPLEMIWSFRLGISSLIKSSSFLDERLANNSPRD